MHRRRAFIIVSLLLGCVWIAVVPPFQAPDEFNHFYRAWQISEGQWTGIRTTDQRLGGWLPTSLIEVARPFRQLPFQPDQHTSMDTVVKTLRAPLHAEQRVFVDFANTAIYPPTAYLPQAAAIALLRALHCPPLWMLYTARLAGFLTWFYFVLLALRWVPFGRDILAFLLFLPTSLVINTSLSADVVTNGFCFLLLALLLKIAFAGDLQKNSRSFAWQIALICGLSALIALHKIAYAPIVLLMWLRPGVWPSRWLPFAVAALCILTVFCWNNITRQLFIPYDTYNIAFRDTQQLNPGVLPDDQLHWMISHPIEFCKTAVVSLVQTLPSATVHYIGKFGWEKNYLPMPLIGILLVAMLLLVSVEQPLLNCIRLKDRVLLILSGLIMAALLIVIMYTLWNPVGAPFIHNLGGKYFIPIVPLWALSLTNSRLVPWRTTIIRLSWFALGLSHLVLLGQVIMRFYD
jgi:uncharacterized membrane protein